MTVSTSYAALTYNGNGVATAFSVTWAFFTGSLRVTAIDADGVETLKTISTHYTVSGGTDSDGLPATGTVTMLVAPASGTSLRIERVTPKTQSSSWTNSGAFQAKALESALDRQMLISQEGGSAGTVNDGINGDVIELVSSGAVDYWDAESKILRGLADPTASTDAVTKGYADTNYGAAAAVAAAASASSASSSAISAAASAVAADASADLVQATWQGQWLTATAYTLSQQVKNDNGLYVCTDAHTSGASTEPGTGASWGDYWELQIDTLTAADDTITNAKLANMATATFKGRTTAGTGDPEDLSSAQATALLSAFVGDSGSGGTKGLVPAPVAGDASKFLRGDGSFVAIPGGGDALVANPLSQFAATTSAQLRGVLSDETGTGAAYFQGGDIGTPSAAVLTNATGLPVATGISGLGTGVGAFLATPTIANLNTAVSNADLALQGKQTIWMPAGAMISRTTNGAASGTVEMATHFNMFRTLDFDTTTQEFAQFEVFFPKSWNLGTVTFQPVLSHASGSGNVVFGLAGVARASGDTGAVAFGTAQTSDTTIGTANAIYIGPESSAITIAGTPAAGETVQFQVNRTVASDTLGVDARLHGIRLFFTTNAGNDA